MAGIAIVVVLAAAWWGSGALARRAKGATLPPLADVSTLPAQAQEQVREADAVARANPASADAVGGLGRAYHASLMTDVAIGTYARAEELDASGWRWTYLRGLLLEERGEAAEARAAYEQVTQKNAGHGLAWFHLGELAFKERRLDDADAAYEQALQAPPTQPFTPEGVTTRRVTAVSPYARMGRARVSIERGRADEAVAILDELIGLHPGFGPARTFRSSVSKDQAAVPAGVVSQGRAYVPPADSALDAVVASSGMRDLLLKHAALAARGGDREWREFLVRRAARFNPRDPNVLMELAAMLQATGRATEALDVLKQHEQLVPGDHHTLVEQGKCLADLGRLDEAESALRRAVRVRDAAAEYNLGTVLDRQGKLDEARLHYERALSIDPFHTRALNNLGVWLDRRGRSAEAIQTLQRAIASDPENAEPYSNLGSAFIGARRMPDALRALETAVALDPEAPDAHNNLGIALAQSGRMADAMREFEAAVRLNPQHVNARRNLEQLRALPR
jgi:tetratricopeptide (TPR) repeat protein